MEDIYEGKIRDYLKNSYNFLITGPAGSGKSRIIQKIQKIICEGKSFFEKFVVTGTTGIASLLANGVTINSWSGFGIELDYNILINKITKRSHLKKRWLNTEILIIDEASMLTKELFDLLDIVGRIIRQKSHLPFGGIQVILVGDFYQLPPVNKTNKGTTPFCFTSDRWDTCITHYVLLTKIYRQLDPKFQTCLNEIRKGKCTDETYELLKECTNKQLIDSDIKPTLLYPHKAKVDSINLENLKNLNTTINIHKSEDVCTNNLNYAEKEMLLDKLDKNTNFIKELKLAVGAQVVLIINLDQEKGLVNGSRGIVLRYSEDYNPIIKFSNNTIIEITKQPIEVKLDTSTKLKAIKRFQYPLQLAWCLTIHKSQGMSLDLIEIDIGNKIFEYGQTYVALSRVRTLEGLYITNIDRDKIKAHPLVKKFYKKIKKLNKKNETEC
tara:strand:+ start:813 stop:2129 length:1317 start_codon:yes stop_codon:yes gene_type:complete